MQESYTGGTTRESHTDNVMRISHTDSAMRRLHTNSAAQESHADGAMHKAVTRLLVSFRRNNTRNNAINYWVLAKS